jgi:hypothetical protein
MFNSLASTWFRWIGGAPCFRIWARATCEQHWRVVDVYATSRRDLNSRWPAPMWPGVCITWTAEIIAVGWDVAESIYRRQRLEPASRARPVVVEMGRLRGLGRRGPLHACEVLAHECGHTWQATRIGVYYWPVGATFTLFREGPHFWNRFENEASEQGMFGGLVSGSVSVELLRRVEGR